jgi:nifR3 family TIM-barrel protein
MSDRKLHIGSVLVDPPLIMAPMAGITNLPFRLAARRHGAGMAATEMVSAKGLLLDSGRTRRMLDTDAAEAPLMVQLFGTEPEVLADAAVEVQEAGASVVDLNVGCPAKKVVRKGAGAALLKDFKLLERILIAMRRAVHVPFTVKTRLGWRPGEGEIEALVPILEGAGVDAVTLHGRFARQGFSGRADWDRIGWLADRFGGPVIGNGDVTSPRLAKTLMDQTGCRGVMIGRAALGNPWIFGQAAEVLAGRVPVEPDPSERLETALAHARSLFDHVGPRLAPFMLRSVLMWYTKGLPESTAFRRSINKVGDYAEIEARMIDYFKGLGAKRSEAAA